MKKYLLIGAAGLLMCANARAQVLCIYCYDQNAPISTPVNNLVLNGGFENTNCISNTNASTFCPNSVNYSCDITNWICTGGGANTYSGIFDSTGVTSVIIEGANAAYFGNWYCSACLFTLLDTSCINNVGCSVTGIPAGYPVSTMGGYGGDTGISLEQTITGLVAGNIYVLEFWAGGEALTLTNSGLFAVDVGFGDTLLRNKATSLIGGIGTRFIVEFIAASSSHTIKFTNWGHICSTCTELVIDDVRLYILEELSSSVPPCAVGINENKIAYATVHPNPFTTQLNINLTDNFTITLHNHPLAEVFLYDITGRKLLQQTFERSATISASHLAAGIYFYEVKNKNGVAAKGKVVKE